MPININRAGQHTLEWSKPLSAADGLLVEPDSLNLYAYPGRFSGPALAAIRDVLVTLAGTAAHVFQEPDSVGAYVLHALLVSNTDASLELALALLEVAPKLLLQTHTGQPFDGEGCLHILCVNRREEMACKVRASTSIHRPSRVLALSQHVDALPCLLADG
eukprot:7389363-Prymnesium_polylepis.2